MPVLRGQIFVAEGAVVLGGRFHCTITWHILDNRLNFILAHNYRPSHCKPP